MTKNPLSVRARTEGVGISDCYSIARDRMIIESLASVCHSVSLSENTHTAAILIRS